MVDQRDYIAGLATGAELIPVAISIGANSAQEIAMLSKGRWTLISLTFVPSAAGNLTIKSGAAGNSGAATAVTGAILVVQNQVYDFHRLGVPVLKALAMNDSLYLVTSNNAAVAGFAQYFEGKR